MWEAPVWGMTGGTSWPLGCGETTHRGASGTRMEVWPPSGGPHAEDWVGSRTPDANKKTRNQSRRWWPDSPGILWAKHSGSQVFIRCQWLQTHRPWRGPQNRWPGRDTLGFPVSTQLSLQLTFYLSRSLISLSRVGCLFLLQGPTTHIKELKFFPVYTAPSSFHRSMQIPGYFSLCITTGCSEIKDSIFMCENPPF